VAVIIALLIAMIAIYYFLTRQKAEDAAVPEKVTSEETVGVPEEAREPALKPLEVALDDSDPVIRELAQALSAHDMLLTWLTGDDLIRKFVAAVDNIANGLSPRAQIDFFSPAGDFPVIVKSGHYYIDPRGYERYDIVADVFAGMDASQFAHLYRRSRPMIQEAYADLGYPDFDFDMTLKRAIIELLKVPVMEEDILLIKKVFIYRMAESKWEKLSAAQKHLLRMGPDNIRLIQEKLRDIAAALEMPLDDLPEGGFSP
jgi:hypothetical protein